MILGIITIVMNIIFVVVMYRDLYTDHATFADGTERTFHRSPMDRLEVRDRRELFYLQLFFVVVSVIAGILIIAGIKNNIVRIIQAAGSVGSVIMFIIIMVVAGNTHPNY